MASLNLVDWRNPSIAGQLRRYRRLFVSIGLLAILVAGAYYQYAQAQLHEMKAIAATQATTLRELANVEQAYQTLTRHQQLQETERNTHLQHGRAMHHFVRLVQLNENGIRIERIHWLPGEIKVTGHYDQVAVVKQLQQQLLGIHPGFQADIQFPRPQQFSIWLTAVTGT
ncbi:hypothetical protein [Idiomarina aquatica]|uniref:Uncharacterized protein n=1 Tax=Idiomarina aquatica TaxID=1327752 RepID=A0AA94EDS3_9GAMM|nr:hypothetical protein [Idiomarina aquatica]RUO40357.1 hypothetical protein CWE23_12185 [Idiomarina aquatica]